MKDSPETIQNLMMWLETSWKSIFPMKRSETNRKEKVN